MTALAFDTLAFARRMEQAGFSRQQAEALAEEQAKLIDERLATKADIAAVRADIETQRLSIGKDIRDSASETKAEILKWVIGTIGLQTAAIIGAVAALVKLLPH